MHEQMKVGVAHGYDADNWRISIQGTTNVGKYAYTGRQFRFQDGGLPYPGDNFTWGSTLVDKLREIRARLPGQI